MNKQELKKWLEANSEPQYRQFSASLLPKVNNIYGVRIPKLRKLARQIVSAGGEDFLQLPQGNSFEEAMLRGLVIAYLPEDDLNKQQRLNEFVPQIDNWSVCDSLCVSLKTASKNRSLWWNFVSEKALSDNEFIARFGLVMMIFHFMNDEYIAPISGLITGQQFNGYYSQMAAGWLIAEIYIRFPDRGIKLCRHHGLSPVVKNMAIRKICESNRVDKTSKLQIKNEQ